MQIPQLYDLYLQHPSVQTDTRKLKEGDIFFALKGPSFNGNEFASKALEAGAAYSVIDEERSRTNERMILVDDVLSALQQLALHHRKQFKIPFIGITGSNGKTTTKELIHAVLSSHYRTYTTEGNLNNHIGVPLTLLKVKKDAEMAVIEMGANHAGEIASYCRYALPTHGLITNCGKAHLEGFGSVEGVKKAKGELFDHLRAFDGAVFIMNDYEYLQKMSRGIREIIQYGTTTGDVVGKVSASDPFLTVSFTKGFPGEISTSLVGDYNLPNVLAAVTLGKYFSVPDEKIKTSIESYKPSNSRSQMMNRGSNKIILDAYNANPSSMKLAIENFSRSAGEKKILVLGAMAELGEDSLSEHKAIVQQIKNHPWSEVVLVGGDFLSIEHPFRKFNNAGEAGKWLGDQNIRDAYLLVKGSRSSQMEKVLEHLQ
jgi:UDP-N-acetylmuramoyl-tripeptide--D-alanyl-D-alanine ligase